MNDDDLPRLEKAGAQAEIPAGHVLIERGQYGAGVYVILDGTVVVEAPEGDLELGPGARSSANEPSSLRTADAQRAFGRRPIAASLLSTAASSSECVPTTRRSPGDSSTPVHSGHCSGRSTPPYKPPKVEPAQGTRLDSCQRVWKGTGVDGALPLDQ